MLIFIHIVFTFFRWSWHLKMHTRWKRKQPNQKRKNHSWARTIWWNFCAGRRPTAPSTVPWAPHTSSCTSRFSSSQRSPRRRWVSASSAVGGGDRPSDPPPCGLMQTWGGNGRGLAVSSTVLCTVLCWCMCSVTRVFKPLREEGVRFSAPLSDGEWNPQKLPFEVCHMKYTVPCVVFCLFNKNWNGKDEINCICTTWHFCVLKNI